MSVDRLLELLKQFKDSTNKRERVCVGVCVCIHIAELVFHGSPSVLSNFTFLPQLIFILLF